MALAEMTRQNFADYMERINTGTGAIENLLAQGVDASAVAGNVTKTFEGVQAADARDRGRYGINLTGAQQSALGKTDRLELSNQISGGLASVTQQRQQQKLAGLGALTEAGNTLGESALTAATQAQQLEDQRQQSAIQQASAKNSQMVEFGLGVAGTLLSYA
jgi:hypothetical protein